MITIVDCGIGNIFSVRRMLESVGIESTVTDKPQDLARATKIIISGVGHFDSVMGALSNLVLVDLLKNMVDNDGRKTVIRYFINSTVLS